MIWDGNTVYTVWGYKPITIPAIKWIKKSDGNWTAVDRGVSYDVFESVVTFQGPESELSDLESVLGTPGGANEANRGSFDITCGAGEEIFGADVNHSSTLTVSVVSYGKITRTSFPQYQMSIRLRLAEMPSFTGSASISDLRVAGFNYEAGSEFDLIKNFYYDRNGIASDGESDPGIYKGTFLQTHSEMKAIRRYLLTTARTASVSFPSFGVSKPFGQRMGAGPFNCKIIDWSDGGRPNLTNWELEITFARVL